MRPRAIAVFVGMCLVGAPGAVSASDITPDFYGQAYGALREHLTTGEASVVEEALAQLRASHNVPPRLVRYMTRWLEQPDEQLTRRRRIVAAMAASNKGDRAKRLSTLTDAEEEIPTEPARTHRRAGPP